MTETVICEIEDGEYAEGDPWKIVSNCEGWEYFCKHAVDHRDVENKRVDGSPYFSHKCTVPYVVGAVNEAGCNGTSVCLECIIEAVKKYVPHLLEDK